MGTHLKYRRHAIALVVMLCGVVSGFANAETPGPAAAGLWANACAGCHNLRDPGDFSDQQWRPIVSHMRVRAGLTGEESRQILAFLQASNQSDPSRTVPVVTAVSAPTNPSSAGDAAASGATIYARDCVACHGKDGKGALPGVSNFTAPDGPLTRSDDELFRSIIDGVRTPGSPLAMPHHGGDPALTNDEIQNVIRYLRQTFAPAQ